MAVQYETLSEFKAYTTRISEYIAAKCLGPYPIIASPIVDTQEIAQEFQSFVNTSGVTHFNWYQKTFSQGKAKRNRRMDEPIIVFNDEKSSNLEDLSALEYIAYKLAGIEPEQGLAVGLYGINNPEIQDGSQNNFPDFHTGNFEEAIYQYGFVPYVYIKGSQEYIMLNPKQIPAIVESNSNYNNEAHFIQLMQERGFVFHLVPDYNLADNFSQFLPVGQRKRYVSKQALRTISDTEITELQPDSLQVRINKFFDSWNKVKDFIPVGYQATTGQNFIANPSFGGGIGPGIITRNSDLTERAAVQEVIVRENPGFSNYVLKQDGFQDSYYQINLSAGASFSYGAATTYVASCWVHADETYQGVPEALFDIQMASPNEQTGQDTIYNVPTGITDVNGEIVIGGMWADNQGNIWRQYKKIFTTPASFDDTGKIIWSLGKSYNATDDTLLYDGSNSNPDAYRYITGLRIETGTEVQNLDKLQLTAINEQSIARVAKDCQSLLNPYDVPMFSFNDFDDFVEGQNVSSKIFDLYVEIKEGLLESLSAITDSSSDAFNNLSQQLQSSGEISGEAAVNISSAFTSAAADVSSKVDELTTQILNLKNSFINNININGGGSGNEEQSSGQPNNGQYTYSSYLTNPTPANNIIMTKNMHTSWNGGMPLSAGYESAIFDVENQGQYSDAYLRSPKGRLDQIDGDFDLLQAEGNFCFTSRPLQSFVSDIQPLPLKEWYRLTNMGVNTLGISSIALQDGLYNLNPVYQNFVGSLQFGNQLVAQPYPFSSTYSAISGEHLFHYTYGNSVNDYANQRIIPTTAESYNETSYLYDGASWNYFDGASGWSSKTLFENGIATAPTGGGLEENSQVTEIDWPSGQGGPVQLSKGYADLVFKKWNSSRAARGLGTEVVDKGKSYLPYLGPDGALHNIPGIGGGIYTPTDFPYVSDSSVIVTTHAYKPGEYMDIKVSLVPNDNFPNPTYTDKLGVSRDLIESYNIFLTGVDKRNYITKNRNSEKGFQFYRKTLFCYNAYHDGQTMLDENLDLRQGFEVEDFYADGTFNSSYPGGQDGGGDLFTNMCPLIPGSYIRNESADFNYLNRGGIRLLPKHLRQNITAAEGGGSVNGQGLENNKHTFLPFSQYHLQPMYGGLCGVPILKTVRTQDLTQAEINAGETAYRIFRLRVQADVPTDNPVMFETRAEGARDASPGIYNDYFGFSATTPYIKYINEGDSNYSLRERASNYAIRYMPSTKNPIWNILSRQWLGVQNFGKDYDTYYGINIDTAIYEQGYLESAQTGASELWNDYGGFGNDKQNSGPIEQSTWKTKYLGVDHRQVEDMQGAAGNKDITETGADRWKSAQRSFWNSLLQGPPGDMFGEVNDLLAIFAQNYGDFPNGETPFLDNGSTLQLTYDPDWQQSEDTIYNPYDTGGDSSEIGLSVGSFDDFTFAMDVIFASTPIWCDFDASFSRPLIMQSEDYPILSRNEFLLNESFEGHSNFNTGFVYREDRFSAGAFLGAGQEYDTSMLDGAHILGVPDQPGELIVNCAFSIVPMLPCAQGSDVDWLGYTPYGKPILGNSEFGSWDGVNHGTNDTNAATNGLPAITEFKTSVQYNGAPFSDEHFQDIGVYDRFGSISSPLYPFASWPWHNMPMSDATRNQFIDLRTIVPGTAWLFNSTLDAGNTYLNSKPIQVNVNANNNQNYAGRNFYDCIGAGPISLYTHPKQAKTIPNSEGGGVNRAIGAQCHRAAEQAVLSTFNILQSQAVPGYHTIPPNLDYTNGVGGQYLGGDIAPNLSELFDSTLLSGTQSDAGSGDFGEDIINSNYPAPYNSWRLIYDIERAVSFGVLCDLYPFSNIGGEVTPMFRRIHNQILWRYNWYGCGIIPPLWRYKNHFVVDDEHYKTSGITGLITYGTEDDGGGGGGGGGGGTQGSAYTESGAMWGWSKYSYLDGESPYDQYSQ